MCLLERASCSQNRSEVKSETRQQKVKTLLVEQQAQKKSQDSTEYLSNTLMYVGWLNQVSFRFNFQYECVCNRCSSDG
jgi:hypothetical protein